MKKLMLLIVLMAGVFSFRIYAQHAVVPQPPAPPPAFVEEPVTEGKALIYLYRTRELLPNRWGYVPLIVSNNGPAGVLPTGRYFAMVADPGTIKIGFANAVSFFIVMEVAAGQTYYVKFDWKHPLILPAETKTEILSCKEWKPGDYDYYDYD